MKTDKNITGGRRKATRRLLALAMVLLALAVGGRIAMRDIPPPDISDLILTESASPTETNAWAHFDEATHLLFRPENEGIIGDYIAGETVDEAPLKDIVDRNAAAVEELRKGADCGAFHMPADIEDYEADERREAWHFLGNVLVLKARRACQAGQLAEAVDACELLMRAGRCIQEEANNDCFVAGLNIMGQGLFIAQELAANPALTEAQMDCLLRDVNVGGNLPAALARTLITRFEKRTHIIDELCKGAMKVSSLPESLQDKLPFFQGSGRMYGYFLQRNKTIQQLAGIHRAFLAKTNMTCREAGLVSVEDGSWRYSLRPNAAGRAICERASSSLQYPLQFKWNRECLLECTRALVGVHAFRRKTGNFPPSLESLVPDYLPSVPRDPYDGKPLRYLPAKGIVYSVGLDCRDSGGTAEVTGPEPGSWDCEDIVFEITPRKPPQPESPTAK